MKTESTKNEGLSGRNVPISPFFWLCDRIQRTSLQHTHHAVFRFFKGGRHLLQRSIPIAEAALFSGFPSPNYMTRVFRRMTGMTPTQYIACRSAAQQNLPPTGA